MTLTAPAGEIQHTGGTITALSVDATANNGVEMQTFVSNVTAEAGEDINVVYNNPSTTIHALITQDGDINVQAYGDLTFNQIHATGDGDVNPTVALIS